MMIFVIIMLAALVALPIASAVALRRRGQQISLRSASSGAQLFIIGAGIVATFETMRATYIQYNINYGNIYDHEGFDLNYLRGAELILLAVCVALGICALMFAVNRDKLGTVIPLAAMALATCLSAAAGLTVAGLSSQAELYYETVLIAVIGAAACCLHFAANLLLSPDNGWQRITLVAVNGVIFAGIIVLLSIALVWGGEVLGGETLDATAILIAGIAIIIFALPSILCLGTSIATCFGKKGKGAVSAGSGKGK